VEGKFGRRKIRIMCSVLVDKVDLDELGYLIESRQNEMSEYWNK
jgi:hypothetical protein